MKQFIVFIIGLVLLGVFTFYWFQEDEASEASKTEVSESAKPSIKAKIQEKRDEAKERKRIEEEIYREKVKNLRFKEIGGFVFDYRYDKKPRNATILLDTKTNVKYIYMWRGMANGGPMMTRLWEE